MSELSELRKRRGVIRRSLGYLYKRVATAEALTEKAEAFSHAQRLLARIETLATDFRNVHYEIVKHITDDGALDTEQEVLDEHDTEVDQHFVRIQLLLEATKSSFTNTDEASSSLQHKLKYIGESLVTTTTTLRSLDPDVDLPSIQQCQEELLDLKPELANCLEAISSLGTAGDTFKEDYLRLKSQYFKCGKLAKTKLNATPDARSSRTTTPPLSSDEGKTGLKVPKLEAPTFDGDILNWTRFWEQFSVAIADRKGLSDSEKFAYLQQSLKGSADAKRLIEGLAGTGEHYAQAVECLKGRYDRPRLIHQSHVKTIVETPPIKDGNGKELRRLHDLLQQHLRALKASESDELSQFITSVIQLKLDPDTLFEWQRHTQTEDTVPPFTKLMEFIDLRARASETTTKPMPSRRLPKPETTPKRNVATFVSNSDNGGHCVVCKSEKHPLFVCSRFKEMDHERRLGIVRANNLCMNCLKGGHFSRNCKSSHHCRVCQKLHHTLLHAEVATPPQNVSSNTAMSNPNVLMMTCRVLIKAPNGNNVQARALLDSASTSSFVSERVVQGLGIKRSHHTVSISGVAGLSGHSQRRSIASLEITPMWSSSPSIAVTAIVVPRVTCELPLHPVNFNPNWTHLSGLSLADEGFGQPGPVDLLLGTDIYVDTLLQGRRTGPPDAPVAFETVFGWVLAGRTIQCSTSHLTVASQHASVECCDSALRKFWEIEEPPKSEVHSKEDKLVVQHFESTHRRNKDGRFIVTMPRRPGIDPLGESRSQAVRRFMSLEKSLDKRGQREQFNSVIQEYLDLGHAERVPPPELSKPKYESYYLPVHVVHKESSTTTKVRAVFDASAKSTSGTSLNDTLYVGPTVHTPLLDVLLRFRIYKIALTTDISKMYRAIALQEIDRDLHRFVWRPNPECPLQDYRMTRVTFGVSSSSFIANMCVKQNAIDFAHQYPLAAIATEKSFYVDDGLTGANDTQSTIELQRELDFLFQKAGFKLHKWNSNDKIVMQHIEANLQEDQRSHEICEREKSTKTLGIKWITDSDEFHLTVSDSPSSSKLTKRVLVSDIACIFDVLGWFSPTVVSMKILLQRLWESNVSWDDPAPPNITEKWRRWREELPILKGKGIARCYYSKESTIVSRQLHGFSDASEDAYSAVLYLRTVDTEGTIRTVLVSSKTKVAPIKRQTIPRLELCGAALLARLLNHVMKVLDIPICDTFAWTDSTVVLNWLTGSPRRFKQFVGNRVSQIVDVLPPERWKHVSGTDNPADCASRGLFPSELIDHHLWWNGPDWLLSSSDRWPQNPVSSTDEPESEFCHVTNVSTPSPSIVVPSSRFSSFNRLLRTISWVIRFTCNCRVPEESRNQTNYLTTADLQNAEIHIFRSIQAEQFPLEINALNQKQPLRKDNALISLSPFIDKRDGLIRVGGRQRLSHLSHSKIHPIILHGNHQLVKLLIRYEHERLLHGGPTLITSSLNRRFHIIRLRVFVRSIVRSCVICRRLSAKPHPPMLGQLPPERLIPGTVFEKNRNRLRRPGLH